MGDEVRMIADLRLGIAAPAKGKIRLFRNGKIVSEIVNDSMDFAVKESGVYRAEVWLEVDEEWRPWIYANPIRIIG